ncbi:alcohol dehydrogenase catalytic domain-containing protein [Edwardsiella ictaluri]|uniref:Alcohol dehydrogenase catalytic domain-containing protein n=1 Tax=Edwardsiella ictaluri TaxID=67780 RepID=A0ABY8GIW6_EDWIC|nr:alcohol dehydrogenase catalytic domain-containing protein [Edwardsiella ictaluri]ELV7528130.1 alcohol dehydrogenase catalytic domain-containing protein [Edwardsiella ictaluri]KMQ78850.1 zinc-binding dehydrogenase [Edwardsiella ictaluri]KOO55518.1 zinc-binding dehydrogenase [Edwardsiella ictaluri]WFN97324.1 alcohol dehydrogenase catalytic domain-containing protein [Edwardsiella ictaluri]
MKALKFKGVWDVYPVEVPSLECIDSDDVIVAVEVCGLCGTDVGIITGDYPVAIPGTTLGHESAGRVLKRGSAVTRFKEGDRVVINPTYSCGECRMCQTGNPNHCERKQGTEAGVSYNGTFAEQYRTKESSLLHLDNHISFEEAALTEPLSCTITGVDKLNITHTNIRACVIGAGPMGMLYLWSLYLHGVSAFLVEKNNHRYRFAKDILPEGGRIYTDFMKAMREEYGGDDEHLDLCVDTTGYLSEVIFDHLAPGGKLLNVALKNFTAKLDILKIADKSLSVIGSIDSLNNSFERSYAMIRDGKIPARKLVSHTFNFDDYLKAFATVGCDIAEKKQKPISEPNCKVLLRIPTN